MNGGVFLCNFVSICALLLISADSVRAASPPYFENFEDELVGTTNPSQPAPASGTFTITDNTGNGSTWAVVSASGNKSFRYSGNVSGSVSTNSSASIGFPDVPGFDFVESTDFFFRTLPGVTTGTDPSVNFGLGALGSSVGFGSGSSYELLYTEIAFADGSVPAGSLTLREVGGDGQVNVISSGTIGFTTAPFTMTLAGVYQAGSLTLTGTLVCGAQTITVTATDSTPLSGDGFGYTVNHLRSGTSAGDAMGANFDNFSLTSAVPEPSSLVLLLVGAAFVARRRPLAVRVN